MSVRSIACIEIGGSGVQTVVFAGEIHRFVDGVEPPDGAVIVLAVPGHIVDGQVAAASTFGWSGVDPAVHVGLRAAPSLVCNDAEAAALGEWVLRGRTDPHLVYIGIGTGIGGATVDHGVVTHANLFGHQPGFGSRRCSCGRTGCLETIAAGWAMPWPLDDAAIDVAASSIATAVRSEPATSRGLVVVAGGIATRYPSIVERIGGELPDRRVVQSSAPAGAKSAAAWGMRELVGSGPDHDVALRVGEDALTCARAAADVVERAVGRRVGFALGVATGSTPLDTYHELARRGVDLSTAWIYLLDEYVGLPRDDPRTYLTTIRGLFADLFGVAPVHVRGPDPNADDLDDECRRFDAEIAERGGIDLQILGIGRNGHIGFNEPGSAFTSPSRPVALTASTRSDNARFFHSLEEVPHLALTQGIGTIVRARSLLLLAAGEAKAPALAAAMSGPISPALPASVIRLHPNAIVVADRAAVGQLRRPQPALRG